jgi:hypothetical protein
VIDRDAALMASADLPLDRVIEVLTGYLEAKGVPDYGPFLTRVQSLHTQITRNGLGREVEEMDQLLPEITRLVEENMRCLKLAADARQLQARLNLVVRQQQDAFMERVQAVLDGYMKSGTAGMRGLATVLRDAVGTVRDVP